MTREYFREEIDEILADEALTLGSLDTLFKLVYVYEHVGNIMSEEAKFSKEMAVEWVDGMENEDGTTGGHWTYEQTTEVLKQKGFNVEPCEFYAVMNSLYSDYSKVLSAHGADNADVFADLAYAWIKDADAVPNKAALYYRCIVE